MLGVFIVCQGLALGARLAGNTNPLVVFAQGIAVVVAVGFVGLTAWLLSNHYYLSHMDQVRETPDTVGWVASRVPYTRASLSEICGEPVPITSLFAITIDAGQLSIRRLPDGRSLVRLDATEISDIQVGHVAYFGGASDCLELLIHRAGRVHRLPLVLLRGTIPGSLVQGNKQLLISAGRLRMSLAESAH